MMAISPSTPKKWLPPIGGRDSNDSRQRALRHTPSSQTSPWLHSSVEVQFTLSLWFQGVLPGAFGSKRPSSGAVQPSPVQPSARDNDRTAAVESFIAWPPT